MFIPKSHSINMTSFASGAAEKTRAGAGVGYPTHLKIHKRSQPEFTLMILMSPYRKLELVWKV